MAIMTFGSVLGTLSTDVPVADAGEDQIVDVGEVVQFDGTGSQDAFSYYWNFRDNGWVNTSPTPTRAYRTEGVYDVGLVITSSLGKQDLDTVRITVLSLPPLAEAGDNATVYENETVSFDGGATTDNAVDMSSLSYRWAFGDGTTAAGCIAQHSYQKAGVYYALLSVTDDQGAIGRDLRTITVLNRAPDVRVLNATADEGDAVVVRAVGSDTASDLNSLRYEWDNGKYGSDTTYTFSDDGVYHPTVTVRDDDNATSTSVGDITVSNVAPIVGITAAKCEMSITLRAAGQGWRNLQLYLRENDVIVSNLSLMRTPGNPNEQEQSLENVIIDISKSNMLQVFYTPNDDQAKGNGATPAWVTLTFGDGAAETIRHTFIAAKPDTWSLEIDPAKLAGNHPISFEGFAFDKGQDAIQLEWDFGDGTRVVTNHDAHEMPSYVTESISHTYLSSGTYELKLLARDDDGGTSEFMTDVIINDGSVLIDNFSPAVEIIGTIPISDEDRPAYLLASGTDDTNLTYLWEFGDGSSAPGNSTFAGNEVFHDYTHSGAYIVAVIVTDSDGARGIAFTNTTIRNEAPLALFGIETIYIYEDEPILFNGSYSTDSPSDQPELSYYWDFGDGDMGFGSAASNVYSSPGVYKVVLYAMDNDGSSGSFNRLIEVLPVRPTVTVSDRVAYGDQPEIYFIGAGDDSYSDALYLNYSWDFGNGVVAYGLAALHSYSLSGSYEVKLNVTDPHGLSAEDVAQVTVVVDSDGDAIPDELETRSSPTNPDTDSDSLVDYWELYVYGTDPARNDTDDDNATDWYEIAYLGYGDTDRDGFANPLDNDSDEDGLKDGDDPNPLLFNAPGGAVLPIVNISIEPQCDLKVVIAIDYIDPNITAPVEIAFDWNFSAESYAIGPTIVFEVPNECNFSLMFIRIKYDDSLLTPSTNEYALGFFKFNETTEKWGIEKGERTGVDPENNTVWAFLENNGHGRIVDETRYDPDGDGLSWYREVTVPVEDRMSYEGYPQAHYVHHRMIGYNTFTKTPIMQTIDTRINPEMRFTDPQDPDTDHDGLYDGWVDRDGDMVRDPDSEPYDDSNGNYYYDIGEPYTDLNGNGRYDYYEPYGEYMMRASQRLCPLCSDTDGDGLFDGWMDVSAVLGYGRATYEDFEPKGEKGDTVLDADHPLPSKPYPGSWGTEPRDRDSDDDGLLDGWNDGLPDWMGDGGGDYDFVWDSFEARGEVGEYRIWATSAAPWLRVGSSTYTDPTDPYSGPDDIPDGQDIDPLVDLQVIVTIKQIVARDLLDFSIIPPDVFPDFYWKIQVSQAGSQTQIQTSARPYMQDSGFEIRPELSYCFPVSDTVPDVYVQIQLYDVDGSYDEPCDISRSTSSNYAILHYDLYANEWSHLSSEDYHCDSNGYGYLDGSEDGSWTTDENDCFMWFDISQTSYDSDNFTYDEEVYVYNSDPRYCDEYSDWDCDSIQNGYEEKYGLNPLDASDSGKDLDNDGISNRIEYELHAFGGYLKYPDNAKDTLGLDLKIVFAWNSNSTFFQRYETMLSVGWLDILPPELTGHLAAF